MDRGPLPTAVACLSKAESFRDFGTNAHARRVAAMIQQVAVEMGLSDGESRQIAHAALLHDIGKLAVPIELLQKSTPLAAEELALIRTHCERGHDILSPSDDPLMKLAASIALSHHEKYDGTGYPHGLSGDAIPLPAQIAAVCDTYDALRQDRPYRRGMTHEDALNIIVNGDNRTTPQHFAPRAWSAFQEVSVKARSIFDHYDGAHSMTPTA
jgi:putative two-component system response regulator